MMTFEFEDGAIAIHCPCGEPFKASRFMFVDAVGFSDAPAAFTITHESGRECPVTAEEAARFAAEWKADTDRECGCGERDCEFRS